MDQLEIQGTDLYDGRHDFDASYFTLGELRTIKRISGLRRGEIADAAAHDDTDLWVAFAVIALQRKMDEQGRGEQVDEDVFWNGRNVLLRFVEATQEEDQHPPPTGEASSDSAASNGNSGNASTTSSAIPATVQQGTGTGSWDPSGSAPPTSPA
jgi:hypothetical protein